MAETLVLPQVLNLKLTSFAPIFVDDVDFDLSRLANKAVDASVEVTFQLQDERIAIRRGFAHREPIAIRRLLLKFSGVKRTKHHHQKNSKRTWTRWSNSLARIAINYPG